MISSVQRDGMNWEMVLGA